MALTGFAYSFMMGSTFSRAQRQVLDMGFADNIHTKVKISGMSFFHFQISTYINKETSKMSNCLFVELHSVTKWWRFRDLRGMFQK